MPDVPDTRYLRISRELFLAAFGANLGGFESWVTDRMVSLLEEDEVRADEVLFSVGDTPEFLYFMREGRVRLVGKTQRTRRQLEGRHVFGLTDGLLDRSRTQTALAMTNLYLMKVRIEAWLELLDDSFELARASVLHLAHSVAQLEERLDTVQGARDRLATRGIVLGPGHLPRGHLNVIERLALLMDVALLRGGGVQALSDLAGASQEVHFDRGVTIFDSGAPRDRVFIVVEGEIEVSREGPDLVRRAGPGEIVCGAAAFGESAVAWTARGAKRGRALAFRVDDWFDLMEEHFDMVRSALSALSSRREELLDELGA
jgi:CRP-like cAMP-binding protein